MASYSTNEFKSGLKVMLDGDPCIILENEFVKPGKGQAFNRVKLRNLKTNRVWEKTYKSGDSLEGADVFDRDMQYLYNDGEFFHFMEPENFEQHQASSSTVGDAALWLREQDTCTVTLYNGAPLAVTPPNFVELASSNSKSSRPSRGYGVTPPPAAPNRRASLSTGATVKVPLFVNQGEIVKCDTRSGEYGKGVSGRVTEASPSRTRRGKQGCEAHHASTRLATQRLTCQPAPARADPGADSCPLCLAGCA